MSQPITLDVYPDLRDATRSFAESLRGKAASALELVTIHLKPARVFGPHPGMSNKENPKGAEEAFVRFANQLKEVIAAKPFQLEGNRRESAVLCSESPQIVPLVYPHTLSESAGAKQIEMIKPLYWILQYPEYPLSALRKIVNAEKRDSAAMSDIAMQYVALNFLFMRARAVLALFEFMRLPIRTEYLPEFGPLPLTVVSTPAGTVLPPDEVIAKIVKLSGSLTAEEVADLDAWSAVEDPLVAEFKRLTASLAG